MIHPRQTIVTPPKFVQTQFRSDSELAADASASVRHHPTNRSEPREFVLEGTRISESEEPGPGSHALTSHSLCLYHPQPESSYTTANAPPRSDSSRPPTPSPRMIATELTPTPCTTNADNDTFTPLMYSCYSSMRNTKLLPKCTMGKMRSPHLATRPFPPQRTKPEPNRRHRHHSVL